MLKRTLLASLVAPLFAAAQSPAPPRPLGTWDVEYDRAILHMHGEAEVARTRGRLTLRAAGDSLYGEIALREPDSTKLLLRGTARSSAWTLYVEENPPTGLAVLMVPVNVAMEWLKETVHGMHPVVVRFDVAARGDSLTGTRTVTGGLETKARTSAVKGLRHQP